MIFIRDEYYAWGLHQIAKAVSFLNNDCKLVGFSHRFCKHHGSYHFQLLSYYWQALALALPTAGSCQRLLGQCCCNSNLGLEAACFWCSIRVWWQQWGFCWTNAGKPLSDRDPRLLFPFIAFFDHWNGACFRLHILFWVFIIENSHKLQYDSH